jgi:integrase/recombinase XerD
MESILMNEVPFSRTHPARRSLRFTEWPKDDQKAWETMLADGDIFDGRGPAGHWRPETRKTNSYHYGRWLGYLAYVDDLDPGTRPEDRVTRKRVESYYQHLVQLGTTAPCTRVTMLVGLKEVTRAMAPDQNWRWLQDLCNRLGRTAKPSKDKAKRIRSSIEIYEAACKGLSDLADGPLDLKHCLVYRDHLMLAFLTARPLRVKNFTALEIGRHMIRTEDRWLITIPAPETKTNADIEFWLPSDLVPWFERYLHEIRPRFPDADSTDQLWLYEKGAALPRSFVYRRIVPLTEKLFGQAINPHLLRDCAATTLSLESIDHARLAPVILSHRSAKTTERYYIQARNLEASRRINGILANIKDDLEGRS